MSEANRLRIVDLKECGNLSDSVTVVQVFDQRRRTHGVDKAFWLCPRVELSDSAPMLSFRLISPRRKPSESLEEVQMEKSYFPNVRLSPFQLQTKNSDYFQKIVEVALSRWVIYDFEVVRYQRKKCLKVTLTLYRKKKDSRDYTFHIPILRIPK